MTGWLTLPRCEDRQLGVVGTVEGVGAGGEGLVAQIGESSAIREAELRQAELLPASSSPISSPSRQEN